MFGGYGFDRFDRFKFASFGGFGGCGGCGGGGFDRCGCGFRDRFRNRCRRDRDWC